MDEVWFLGLGANHLLPIKPTSPLSSLSPLALKVGPIPSLLSPPLPFHPVLPPLPSFRSRPPYIQLRVWGSAVSSPSGVWDRAPAKIEFGAI